MLKKIFADFQQIFKKLAGEDIVLYGTGVYAQELLQNRKCFPANIVGVMDKTMTAGTFMGLPVIAQTEQEFSFKHIVIAAAKVNCGEIYDRIAPLEKLGVSIHLSHEYREYLAEICNYSQNMESMRGQNAVICGDDLEVRRFLKERKRLPYTVIGILNIGLDGEADMGMPVFDIIDRPFPYRHVVVVAPENKCEDIRRRIAILESAGISIHLPKQYEKYRKALEENNAASAGWHGLFDSSVLDGIGIVNLTDKSGYFDEAHDWLRKYEFFLRPYRDASFTLLELGVFNGSSLKTWKEYFTKARLVGVDIDEKARRYADSRTEIVVGDLGNESFVDGLNHYRAHVIIDDASHRWDHQLLALFTLYPAMSEKGIYILEDIHTSFSPLSDEYEYQGAAMISPFTVLQKLAEGLTVSARNHFEKDCPFKPIMAPGEFDEKISALAQITEAVIFFACSCVLIRK